MLLELGSLLTEASTARQPRMWGKTRCQVGLSGREMLNYIPRTQGYQRRLEKTEVKFTTEVILEGPWSWLCNALTATTIHHSALTG